MGPPCREDLRGPRRGNERVVPPGRMMLKSPKAVAIRQKMGLVPFERCVRTRGTRGRGLDVVHVVEVDDGQHPRVRRGLGRCHRGGPCVWDGTGPPLRACERAGRYGVCSENWGPCGRRAGMGVGMAGNPFAFKKKSFGKTSEHLKKITTIHRLCLFYTSMYSFLDPQGSDWTALGFVCS